MSNLAPVSKEKKAAVRDLVGEVSVSIFEDEDQHKLRVIERDGEPWFVLSDVCAKLGIANVGDAGTRLDDDEKDNIGITDVIGRSRSTTIINESGLYSLILTSRKPAAKRFKKWVTSEVLPSIRRSGVYQDRIPEFIRRFNENFDRVDHGYFSVISQLVQILWGRLEMVGHRMADRGPDGKQLRPDNSVGRLFAKWLEEHHPTVAGNYSLYLHKTDEWEGEVRQYPRALLPLFVEYVEDVWIPEHAERYFSTRDPAAIPHLPKLLPPVARG